MEASAGPSTEAEKDHRPSSTPLRTSSRNPFVASSESGQSDENSTAMTTSSIATRDQTLDESSDPSTDEQAQLTFGATMGQIDMSGNGVETKAVLLDDGRLNIKIDQRTREYSELLASALQSQAELQRAETLPTDTDIPPPLHGLSDKALPPPLNVVIHVVGSRGDVQPFVALGKVLKETYGHRVRLATHGTFKAFIEDNGLEFFQIGGDPAELMAFMVKNPGLMPGMETLRSGDIGKRRKGISEIIQGCWRSCIEEGDGTTVKPASNTKDSGSGLDEPSSAARPFIAEAIIANPPSFAHLHIAEKLGIPLHLMFTMPWSPTQSFPHPLANIHSNADTGTTNFASYALVEMMTWQGLGDLINKFRKQMGLEPVSLMWAPGMAARLQIPYTYCWSPALIPKPKDWGTHIDISGFYFLSLASQFTPAPDLQAFLDSGPPPVYIGFGSIVVDDPDSMTNLTFEAVKKSGQRALVSKGWGGFGATDVPDGVFMLGNVPHDWLFKHVSCVVHHGGAGTTAAGIALGKPTVVVPFFGDQPFWGAMVARAGAGPDPIPNKELTADKLAAGILKCLEPSTLGRAKELGAKIESEKGTSVGAKSFHDKLGVESLRCMMAPDHAAVWRVKRTKIRLSAFAVATLSHEGLLDVKQLKLYRPREYICEDAPWDPISGIITSTLGTSGDLMMGVVDYHKGMLRAVRPKSSRNGSNAGNLVKSNQQAASSINLGDSSIKAENDDVVLSNPSKGFSHYMNASGTHVGHASVDAAMDVTKGTGKMIGATLKTPMDFTLGLAKGFHNAPKLYGDDTVRQPDKVTGVQSGLKTAGKEFGFGLYDGITGLVTQPVRGAKKEGFMGAMKGIGKGIGGVILKPSAAACAVPGYTFQGIYKEMRKSLGGSSVENHIIAVRTAQGYEEWNRSSNDQRREVMRRWQAIKVEAWKEKDDKRHRPSQSGSLHHGDPSPSFPYPEPPNSQLPPIEISSSTLPSHTPTQAESGTSHGMLGTDGYQVAATPSPSSFDQSRPESLSQRPRPQSLNSSHSISRKPVPSSTPTHD